MPGDSKMKARYWTAWERYMPRATSGAENGTAGLCLQPWDQILPEEGVQERLAMAEPLWRAWETRLPEAAGAALSLGSGAEKAGV